jgi:GrpB-like predicted nucleotidyltransferase (UPF0157 family)
VKILNWDNIIMPATIEIVNYTPEWREKFLKEKDFLEKIAGEWLYGSIEHVGSTSIKGLCAKPVIDIMFGVKSLKSSKAAIKALTAAGYSYADYKTDVMHWFCKPLDEFRTHHLHLIPYESDLWKERLKFRDVLRNNSKLANDYANLKILLAKKFKNDREIYTQKKYPFIKMVLDEY